MDGTGCGRRTALKLGLHTMLSGAALSSVGEVLPDRRKEGTIALPFIRGINLSGGSYSKGFPWPSTDVIDYYIAEKRMNVVRLPIRWELVQPKLMGELDGSYLSRLDEQVSRVSGKGAWIILDLHNFGRRNVNGATKIVGQDTEATSAHLQDCWGKLAKRYRQRSSVIFGLMNEPHNQDDELLLRTSNSAILAIRRTGAHNLILVNGNDWGSAGWQPGADNYSHIGPGIVDPDNNFVFDIHQYFDDTSGTNAWCRNGMWQRPIEAFTKWARRNGKRGFCGEFASGSSVDCGIEVKAFLEFIEGNRDVWIGWAWWGGGGFWSDDYIFRLDPYGWRQNADAAGMNVQGNWRRPWSDMPQMKFIEPFL